MIGLGGIFDRSSHLHYRVAASVLLTASLGLAGCSSVPDAVNPAEWYKSTVEVFSGDEKASADEEAQRERDRQLAEASGKEASGSGSFPKVGDVEKQRQARNLGLSADPDRPRYAPPIARQSETAPSNTLTEAAPAPAAPPAPSPMAPKTSRPTVASSAPAPVPAASAPTTSTPAMPKLKMPEQKMAAAPDEAKEGPVDTGGVPSLFPRMKVITNAEQEAEFDRIRKRFNQQLAEIQARAQQRPSIATGVPAPTQIEPMPSIVISSAGVQGAGEIAFPQMAGAVASGRTATAMPAGNALPLPSDAVRVATIVFPNGSSRLTRSDRRIIAQVVALQREQGGVLRVIGHSSSRTRAMDLARHRSINYKVSEQRAKAVSRELVRQGANRRTVLLAAVADSQPLYQEIMPTGEAGNRRAEIYLTR